MSNIFECKVRYDKITDDGMQKTVTEAYLVEAMTFTEAESRFIEEITPFMSGEFEVADVSKRHIAEIFDSSEAEADKWYKVKCAFITIDERTATEKRKNSIMYVKAKDLRDAVKRFDEGMKGTLADYDIVSVAETAIMDLFKYNE